MAPAVFSGKWPTKFSGGLLSLVSFVIFLILDFIDALFCMIYGILDECFEGEASLCFCRKRKELLDDGEDEQSETLYSRKNVFKEISFLGYSSKRGDSKKRGSGLMVNRWSDCGCESCASWMKNGDQKLHVIVREPSKATTEDCRAKPADNVIFLHGFLCSSSFWTETVFPNLSETIYQNYRLFAVDLLGFGKSPKPRDCSYTLQNHVEAIEKSVICPFGLGSFHLVAHSMGCVVALALAAKYSNSVKSITFVSPPYFPASKEGGSLVALKKLAGKRLWPPLLFASSVMSWYEHLGRCVCFLICRHHRTWEEILKLLNGRRDLHFMIVDLTRHTHQSAWHTMHNVICGGAKVLDGFLVVLVNAGLKICVIHGDRDPVVPIECIATIKMRAPDTEVHIIRNADHASVVLGREKEFALYLGRVWTSVADIASNEECSK